MHLRGGSWGGGGGGCVCVAAGDMSPNNFYKCYKNVLVSFLCITLIYLFYFIFYKLTFVDVRIQVVLIYTQLQSFELFLPAMFCEIY